ncbi:glycosyltransferase family 1 protein [Rhizobium sp. BK602]|uniref:glycosyltransferase family 4 protein n=1 Tax=Rhizobium sp. BK602 TaxID=2586986 RepID=UPI00160F795B|nr:glycosyltransferase family 1 protein [Rhizobium sp. BK602]MBB3611606.1 glycosyltransferase involved in cell wall biosynthesis [Rhizobium sp. BK602]
MRLWIDGQCFQTASRLRGIGRYVQELILGIVDNHPDVELVVSLNAAMPLEALAARDHLQKWIKPDNIHMWHGIAAGGEGVDGYTEERRLSEIALAYHVSCLGPDIALSASPFEGYGDRAVPLTPNDITGIPIASIFYDAIPYRYPQQYLASSGMRSYYERRLAFYARYDLNLCISDYSRTESIALSKNERAVNILAGVSKDFIDAIGRPNAELPNFIEKPFILYVGGLDWRKNVKSAIEAFAQLPSEMRNRYSFVLAGDHPQSLLKDEMDRWLKLGLPEEDLITLGHVTDTQLVSLYKATDLAIQPSLLEGFGLTALEAMTCGAPIIASKTGALPEVIGDSGLLFDPADAKDIARVMEQALTHQDGTKAIAEEQRFRAQEFSWAKSAAIAVDALEETVALWRSREAASSEIDARKTVLGHVDNTTLSADEVAELLARSEKVVPTRERLILDATSTYRIDHKTGIQRVVKNICANLETQDDDGVERVVAYSDSLDGWFAIPETLEKNRAATAFTTDARLDFSARDRILMLDSSWEFYRHHYVTLRAARLRGATVISCLYDTIPLRFPGFCDPGMPPLFSSWFQAALSYSNAFICISKAVADELIAILEAIQFPREMKIGYWHLGADFAEQASSAEVVAIRQDERPSFLMVGTLEPRKGHAVALDAFDILWGEGRDITLTIVGKPGWGVEHVIRRIENHPEYGKRLFWFNGISDEKLQKAYADSDALIAASFAEGFGLPIVEAGHFGKSVIASDIPVFREVTAYCPHCDFFTVGSPASLAETVRTFIRSRGDRSAAVASQDSVSWQSSAQELQNVVLNEKWYKVYKPGSDKTFVPISAIGNTKMQKVLRAGETQHTLELVEGPIVIDRMLKYTVRVTNLSASAWSSAGVDDGSLAVKVGYRVFAADGRAVAAENPRISIPFVLPAGDSLYVAIEIPVELKKNSGAFAEVALIQEAVGWWSDPLRVSL